MDAKIAARMTRPHIDQAAGLPDKHPEYGKDHLHDMVTQIEGWDLSERKVNEKAMRWIGWLQACVVMGGGATLEEMKHINKAA